MANDGTIKLGYDGKQVEAGFSALESRSKRSAAAVEGSFSALSSRVSSAYATITGVAGVALASRAIKGLLSDFDDIGDSSIALGVSAESFQRMKLQAELSGASVDSLARSMLKMEANLQRGGDEGDKLAAALRGLKINTDDFIASAPEQRVAMLAAAFQKARAEGRGLSEIQDLFKRQFTELIPLLSLTADEAARLASQEVVSNEDVAILAKANDQLGELGNRIKVIAATSLSRVVSELDLIAAAYGRYKANQSGITAPDVSGPILGPQNAPISGPREGTPGERDSVKKAEARAKLIAAAEKELSAARSAAALEQATEEGKLALLIERREEVQRKAVQAGVDEVEAIKLRIEYQQLALDIARQEKTIAEKKVAVEKEAADAKKNAARAAENQQRAVLDLQDEIAIAQEKDPTKKAALERQRRIRDDQRRIMRDTGLDPQAALAAANGINPELDDRSTSGGRRKIRGYSGAQRDARKKTIYDLSFDEFFKRGKANNAAAVNGGNAKIQLAEGRDLIEVNRSILSELKRLTVE